MLFSIYHDNIILPFYERGFAILDKISKVV